MSSDPRLDVLDKGVMHGGKSVSISCSREVDNKVYLLDLHVRGSNTNASHSPGAQNAGVLDECIFESNGTGIDLIFRRQDSEVRKLTVTPLSPESTSYSLSDPVFGHEENEQNGELLKHVLDKHSVAVSSKAFSLKDAEMLIRFVDLVTSMTHCFEVRQAFLRRICADPSLLRHIAELVQAIDTPTVPTDLSPQHSDAVRRNQNVNGYDDDEKALLYIRSVGALGRLFKKVGKRGSQAIRVIVDKIRFWSNVARPLAGKAFRAIKIGFLWIVRAIVDPQGEIRENMDDSEKSKCIKTLGIIGVMAIATVGALIISFGTAGTGPFGVGAATVGVAATSAAVRRQPCHRQGL